VFYSGVCDRNVWPDARYNFLDCQYNIYRLVQNIFPGDMNFQMRRFEEYSKK